MKKLLLVLLVLLPVWLSVATAVFGQEKWEDQLPPVVQAEMNKARQAERLGNYKFAAAQWEMLQRETYKAAVSLQAVSVARRDFDPRAGAGTEGARGQRPLRHRHSARLHTGGDTLGLLAVFPADTPQGLTTLKEGD